MQIALLISMFRNHPKRYDMQLRKILYIPTAELNF
jgi:hypothetical protein